MKTSDRPKGAITLVVAKPEVIYTKSGAMLVLLPDVWDCQDGPFRLHIDFTRIPEKFSTQVAALKEVLIHFIKGYSPAYASNLYEAFVHFVGVIDKPTSKCKQITLHQIQQYASQLDTENTWRVTTLNALLQKWHGLGYSGVEEECVEHLRELRKPGNNKGDAVRTHDPVRGPFCEQEYTLLYRALDAAYGKGGLPQWAFVLGRLLFATGQRISQYASMKVSDLVISFDKKNQRRTYQIKVPKAKTGLEHARKSFLTFDLSPQTGALLLDYTNELYAQKFDADSAMFPMDMLYIRSPKTRGQKEFEGHCTAAGLSRLFSVEVKKFAPSTGRLNHSPTPISSTRFRYTFGSRMVEEGASRIVVANRLGHADLQNVEVYYEATPTIVDNIDKLMGGFLAPVAQAFAGKLVEDEKSSTFQGAPGTRIVDFRSSSEGLGSCSKKKGKNSSCSLNKPVACYVCFKYEPWLDGPHQQVLKRLLLEREPHAGDPKVASINDDSILAIREVIAECNAVMAQRSLGGAA